MAILQAVVNELSFVQGCRVQVDVTNGKSYEGILSTISPDVRTTVLGFQCHVAC